MAVVFISPKKRQRMFLMGIVTGLAIFVLLVALTVFFSQPKQVASELTFNKPKINIDFSVFDSQQFKDLVLFEDMKTQFYYLADTEREKTIEGFVAAVSMEEARQILEGMNLRIIKLEEAKIGRDNPFIPYYQSADIFEEEEIENNQE